MLTLQKLADTLDFAEKVTLYGVDMLQTYL
jgi:hypothetical protein